jgi:hypothetical protein
MSTDFGQVNVWRWEMETEKWPKHRASVKQECITAAERIPFQYEASIWYISNARRTVLKVVLRTWFILLLYKIRLPTVTPFTFVGHYQLFRGTCLYFQGKSLQSGVRIPPGVHEDILEGRYAKTSYGVCTKKVLFRDKHWIIMARYKVNHRRLGRKDIWFNMSEPHW